MVTLCRIVLCVSLCHCWVPNAIAITLNWNPSNPSVAQSYHQPANWTPAQVPTVVDLAQFSTPGIVVFGADAVSQSVIVAGDHTFLPAVGAAPQYSVLATALVDSGHLTVADTDGSMALAVGGLLTVSNSPASLATLTATGAQALVATNELWVGRFSGMGSNADLNVLDGATLSTNIARIASATGENPDVAPPNSDMAAVYVVGDGSTWTNAASGEIYVGDSYHHRGLLRVADAGTVSTGGLAVASLFDPTATGGGAVEIEGSGSALTVSQTALVGYRGVGMLNVSDGGRFESALASLGEEAGAFGAATITGAGSVWENSSNFFVGSGGGGQLVVSDAASVSNLNGFIAFEENSAGDVQVTGVDSTWGSSSNLSVGHRGVGSLTISSGGEVFNSVGFVGLLAGSSGEVVVTGAGSRWLNNSNLDVGEFGEGRLSIYNGGMVENQFGFVSYESGSHGNVTVEGTDSLWRTNQSLFVGSDHSPNPSGVGHVEVHDGATLSVAGNLHVIDGSRVVVRDSTIEVTGLAIEDGGEFLFNGGLLRVDSSASSGPGSFDYVAGAFQLTDAGGYTVGANNGPLDKALGGDHVVRHGGNNLIVDHQLAIPAGKSLTVDGSQVIAEQITNAGSFYGRQATLQTDTGLRNDGDLVLVASTVDGPVENSPAATVTIVDAVSFNGPVTGPADFFGPGTVSFNNVFAPGASPGEVAFEGSVRLAADSLLQVELGGTAAGEYDALRIAGDVDIAGALDLSVTNGFLPAHGDVFGIVTAAGATLGFFAGLAEGDLVTAISGVDLHITYTSGDGNDVAVYAVSEGLFGDYNTDGVVDAADYTVWRDNVGSPAGALPNDPTGGPIGTAQYETWRANYGLTATSSAAGETSLITVPETATRLLAVWLMIVARCTGRRPRLCLI